MRKKTKEVNKYILIGFKKLILLPNIYSFDKKPGLKSRSFSDVKNLPSKWVTSLKKCDIKCQTLSLYYYLMFTKWYK